MSDYTERKQNVPKYVLDTNIVIGKAFDPNRLPATLYMSSVVLSELMSACNDVKELKAYQNLWRQSSRDNLLLVPTESDWLDASRILYLLAQERKKASGFAPKQTAKAKQETVMDCLLAMSAHREGVTITTNSQ